MLSLCLFSTLAQCDVFSLGISAYQIITKEEPPANGDGWHDLRHGTIVFPPGCEADLVEIVQLLMHVRLICQTSPLCVCG